MQTVAECGITEGARFVRDPLAVQRERIFDINFHANGGPRADQNICCVSLLCLPCNGLCPLHCLAMTDCSEGVELLTSNRCLPFKFIPCSPCDPNSVDPLWCFSQAHGWAASHGQLHPLMMLAQNGADIERCNCAGNNARKDAERKRHTHVVEWIDKWREVGSPRGCALPI